MDYSKTEHKELNKFIKSLRLYDKNDGDDKIICFNASAFCWMVECVHRMDNVQWTQFDLSWKKNKLIIKYKISKIKDEINLSNVMKLDLDLPDDEDSSSNMDVDEDMNMNI